MLDLVHNGGDECALLLMFNSSVGTCREALSNTSLPYLYAFACWSQL